MVFVKILKFDEIFLTKSLKTWILSADFDFVSNDCPLIFEVQKV